MTDWRPERKIKAAGIAWAVTTILVFALSQAGVFLPPKVETAVGVLVGAIPVAVGYIVKGKKD